MKNLHTCLHLLLIAAIILARLSVYMARLTYNLANLIGDTLETYFPGPCEAILTLACGALFLALVIVAPWLLA